MHVRAPVKRAVWVALVAAALGGVAAVMWWRYGSPHAPSAPAGESIGLPPAKGEPSTVRAEHALPQEQHASHPVPGADYAALFHVATDLLDFTRSLLGAARAGDHAAQFYIFRALEYCTSEYRLYFDRQHFRYSLDDALKSAVSVGWPFDPEVVRRTYDRCHTMMESGLKDPGERSEWLRLSSEGGYPLAQVNFARYQAIEARKANSDDAASREERRRAVAKALRSRDPAVIWEIGNSPYITVPIDGEPGWDSMVWSLAACLRGFDCSPQSEAVRLMCLYDRACQPYETVADIIRRVPDIDFPELEARARDLNEKMDDGDWEALGF